jgi:hypothetical protein
MKEVQFNPKTVNGALDASKAALTGPERGSLSPEMNTVFNNFKTEIAGGSASADDLNGYARKIFSAAKNDSDYRLAGKVRDAINNDIMARTMPTSNHSLGEAAGMNADANQAFARLKDSQWLSGTDVSKAPSEAATRLADPTKLYGPNERDALDALAKFAPKGRAQTTPTSPGAGAWQGGKDTVTGLAKDKLVPVAVGWALDGITGGVGGLLTGLLTKMGYGAYKGYRGSEIQRAIDAAHASLTTGQKLSPSDYINPAVIRPAVRQGVTGILAAGGP